MRFAKALTAVAVATSLVSTPVLAGAQNLSVAAAQRDAAPAGKEENLKGGAIVVTLLAIFLVVGGVLVFLKDNNEDLPTSP